MSTRSGIAFVVPHRYREPIEDVVEWCLAPLVKQLGPNDCLSVSDQGSPEELFDQLADWVVDRNEPRQDGTWPPLVCITDDDTPPTVWNIARARNRGLELAKSNGDHKYVWPIDIDIRVPDGAVEQARAAMDAGAHGLAPLVRDRVQGPEKAARIRPGSGIAVLRVEDVQLVGGWDEAAFSGYGSEDIDLFYRFEKRIPGWRCELWRDGPVFLHQPHLFQEDKLDQSRRNMALLETRRHR